MSIRNIFSFCEEKNIKFFMKLFSNLKVVKKLVKKGVDKHKDKNSRINFLFFVTITKKVHYFTITSQLF